MTAAFHISGWFQEEIKKVSSLVRRSTMKMTYKEGEDIVKIKYELTQEEYNEIKGLLANVSNHLYGYGYPGDEKEAKESIDVLSQMFK